MHRGHHCCRDPRFKAAFKELYQSSSDVLLGDAEVFKFSMTDELEMQQRLEEFEELILSNT